jgi:hypothetical protein
MPSDRALPDAEARMLYLATRQQLHIAHTQAVREAARPA